MDTRTYDLTKYNFNDFPILENKYQFDNPENNKWLTLYNDMVRRDYGKVGPSLHHIKPRKKFPELKDDRNNWCMCPIYIHFMAHYCLWKYSWTWAAEFRFIYYYFRKKAGWYMTPEEETQLKADLKKWNSKEKKQRRGITC